MEAASRTALACILVALASLLSGCSEGGLRKSKIERFEHKAEKEAEDWWEHTAEPDAKNWTQTAEKKAVGLEHTGNHLLHEAGGWVHNESGDVVQETGGLIHRTDHWAHDAAHDAGGWVEHHDGWVHKALGWFHHGPVGKWVHKARAAAGKAGVTFLKEESPRHYPGEGATSKGFLPCPKGYDHRENPLQASPEAAVQKAMEECGLHCDRLANCLSFRFSPVENRCIVLHHKEVMYGMVRDYQHCEKQAHRGFDPAEAPHYLPEEYQEQSNASLQVGDDVWLYAIGSSSLLWMTWIDQFHLTLQRLGYKLPALPTLVPSRWYPRSVPSCDDTKYFEHLKTTRFGRIGWSSWDFAFDGWEGCVDGFRTIEGHKVKCQHGAGCAFSTTPLNASLIAEDASRSNITLLATWFNDDQHWSTHFRCFNGTKTGTRDVSPVTVACLLRMIRAIHERSPNTWVVVMGKYPQTYHHITYPFLEGYNRRVKEAVEKEPRTIFVDFYMPNADEGDFFQVAHSGHPNCRGSKLMAHAALDRLYREGALRRGLKLLGSSKEHILNDQCADLGTSACHTSALCWLDPEDRKCKAYNAGTWNYHTVCEGNICKSEAVQVI